MTDTAAPVTPDAPTGGRGPNWFLRLGERLDTVGSVKITLLAALSAMVVGGILIVVTDPDVWGNGEIGTALNNVWKSYWALGKGSFGSLRAISDTITATTPYMLCGLSVAIAFKAGLFNIGATGQMLAGGMCALYVGAEMHGPGIIQIPLAVLAAAIGGAAYGAIPGILKARTGAHEVITTIMLNNIAAAMVLYLLKTSAFQRPGRTDPISKLVSPEGRLPKLFGFTDRLDLTAHAGIFIALGALVLFWWVLTRSTLGFEFRAQGFNADAAEYAGMHTKRLTVFAMCMAGAFAGLAGSAEVLGTYGYASQNFAGNIGFDAIAIALLGRSSPVGTALSAVLFGALQAGAREMQSETSVPIDLIIVLRALIVMFIAAPLLVKAIWRVRAADTTTQSFKGWGS